jgi:hypothetical protein
MDPLFTLVERPSRLDVYGLDDDGLFTRLARARSWTAARCVLGSLSAHSRHFTLVATGTQPPEPFLRALGSHLDQLILVPEPWLSGIPRHFARRRARHAARLALAHLVAPIQSRDVFSDYDVPF